MLGTQDGSAASPELADLTDMTRVKALWPRTPLRKARSGISRSPLTHVPPASTSPAKSI